MVSDGYLAFLHALQQGALDLGGSSVHLVGEYHVGEYRPLVNRKFRGARVVYLRAYEVGRQKVRGELDTRKVRMDGLGESLNQEGLGKARDAFEKYMPVC